MITRLKGVLVSKQAPRLVLDVQGVGYEVFAPMSTFYQLPAIDETVTLLTQLIVREDSHTLYGFYQERERALFSHLIKVNGVGPKLALTILSGIEPPAFIRCVSLEDTHGLVKIPGIGKKTAERLIIELKDKVEHWNDELPQSKLSAEQFAAQQPRQEAQSALEALGYKPAEAKRALAAVHEVEANSEQLIRLALKQMMAGV